MAPRPLSPVEAEIVSGLDSSLQPIALEHRRRALEAGFPFVFLSGIRSRQQQAAEAARDNRATPAAPAGQSKHEVGFAYDVERQLPAVEAKVGAIAEQLGLKWGGRFRDAKGQPSPDPNHFEAPQPRAELATYRNLKLAAGAALMVGAGAWLVVGGGN